MKKDKVRPKNKQHMTVSRLLAIISVWLGGACAVVPIVVASIGFLSRWGNPASVASKLLLLLPYTFIGAIVIGIISIVRSRKDFDARARELGYRGILLPIIGFTIYFIMITYMFRSG
ncbi:MAG: hypothetical protein Q4B29_01570 [Candidatus Saccharibacteria bacterium]|nr:hypothetical protein [Candidatus Saccharibacteria bacterium]